MTVDGAVIPQAPAAAEDGKASTGASDQQRRYIHCPNQPERGKVSNLFMACTKASLLKKRIFINTAVNGDRSSCRPIIDCMQLRRVIVQLPNDEICCGVELIPHDREGPK